MIILNTENLSVSFGDDLLFRGVSFSVDEKDKLGIIGHNGCGKSTLFKLILGELEADEGQVYISKNKTVGVLYQNGAVSDDISSDMSAIDVMYASHASLIRMEKRLDELQRELDGAHLTDERRNSLAAEYGALNERFIADGGLEFRGRCESTLIKMGFDRSEFSRPYSTFSGGERTRLALCRELCLSPDILMLDEPTNHLDIETLGWLESYLTSYRGCVLVISHDRYFLDRVTNKTLCIENRSAKLYDGNYTQSMQRRKTDREIQYRHYINQQKEIAHHEEHIARQRAWNRERNIIAAESRLKLLEKMERIECPESERVAKSFGFSSSIASGNDVMYVKGLGFSYQGSRKLFENVSFTLFRGDRLFVAGPNGCGKSTLIKLLAGKLNSHEGYVDMGYNVNVGYFDQENQQLDPANTVLEELWSAYPTFNEVTIRNTLARFYFYGDDVYKSVSNISGGERARLTLSKLILSDVNLLILDEPTNHLDIDSREALEEAIENFDGTVVAVSHDRYFIQRLATRVLDMSHGGVTDIPIATKGRAYDELCEDRERREALASHASEDATVPQRERSGKEQYLQNKKNAAEARRQIRRAEALAKEARAVEERLDQIASEMSGNAAYDYVRLSELDGERVALEERLLEIYEEIGV